MVHLSLGRTANRREYSDSPFLGMATTCNCRICREIADRPWLQLAPYRLGGFMLQASIIFVTGGIEATSLGPGA